MARHRYRLICGCGTPWRALRGGTRRPTAAYRRQITANMRRTDGLIGPQTDLLRNRATSVASLRRAGRVASGAYEKCSKIKISR